MLVIDAHTHWYPESVSANPVLWAKENSEEHWGALMSPRADGKRILQGFPNIEKFLADMDDAKIDRAVIQGWYWKNRKSCDFMNAEVMKAVRENSDRLSAFASINPAVGDVDAQVRHAHEEGFVGIGELHDGVQGFAFDSDNFGLMCESAAKFNMPVCVHLDDPDGKNYPNKIPTNNRALYAAAEMLPDTRFIFSHWGGGEVFKANFKPLKNVYYDTAANTFLYGKAAWKNIPAAISDKIIYGSDYPLRLYPSLFKNEEMLTFFSEATSQIDSEFAEKFFAANYLFLFERFQEENLKL